jgi:hypothetical protein
MKEGKSTHIETDENATFIFTDGSRLKTDSYHHIYVDTSSDIVIGTGARYKGMTKLKDFEGQVDLSNVDSTGTQIIWGDTCFVCWLKNGTYLKFKEEDYVKIREGDRPGLWCVGKLDSLGEDHLYKGRLPDKDVREIEVPRVSQMKTGLLILLMAPIAALGVLMLSWSVHGPIY